MRRALKSAFWVLLLGCGMLVAAQFMPIWYSHTYSTQKYVAQAQKKLNEKEQILVNKLTDTASFAFLKKADLSSNVSALSSLIAFSKKYELPIMVYKNDSMVFWTDNAVAFPRSELGEYFENNQILLLKNGWNQIVIQPYKAYDIIGLIPIKHAYNYQNQYLENTFVAYLELPKLAELIPYNDSNPELAVKSLNKSPLFTIAIDKIEQPLFITIMGVMASLLGIIGLSFFLHSLVLYAIRKNRKVLALLLAIIPIIGIRSIMLYYKLPEVLYDIDLFNPKYYASNFVFPSLGDFFINCSIVLWLGVLIFKFYCKNGLKVKNNALKWAGTALIVLVVFVYNELFSNLFRGLIINSSVSFDITNILNINIYSVIGLLSLGMLLYAYYLITDAILCYIHATISDKLTKYLIYFLVFIFFILLRWWFIDFNVLPSIVMVYFLFLDRIKSAQKYYLTFPTTVVLLSIFSIIIAVNLVDFEKEKEHQYRELLINKLQAPNDPITEYLFVELAQQLVKDASIGQAVADGAFSESSAQSVQKRYLGGYFSKYDIVISPILVPANADATDGVIPYWDSLLAVKGEPVNNGILFFLKGSYARQHYVGRLPVALKDDKIGFLILDMRAKYYSEKNSFPALLLEGNLTAKNSYDGYAYAVYQDRQLTAQFGDFPFKNVDDLFLYQKSEKYLKYKGYEHLVAQPEPGTNIVLSRKTDIFYKPVTIFSYAFAALTFFILTMYVRRSIATYFRNLRAKKINNSILFKTRIQFSMIGIVIISLLLIGYITFVFVKNRSLDEQQKIIDKQIKTIINAVERTGTVEHFLQANGGNLSAELKNLSDLYTTDINLYDHTGRLVQSTQPKIFEQALISPQINPSAINELGYNMAGSFSANEKIGSLKYLSVYLPLRNAKNEVAAYINLPFFSNEESYRESISSLLTTLINVYVLLFSLTGFFAFFIANSITYPLTLIQQQLRLSTLASELSPIVWKKNDEIGQLVFEYNKMIEELAQSAEKLARNERELAWREMARQIAHEIKNPLTPIKLGTQLLNRALEDNDPNFEEKFRKFSKTLIQQIDSLSAVASEFSTFASIATAKAAPIDVLEVVNNVRELYAQGTDVEIVINANVDLKAVVMANADHINRIFNNLIKNALQALDDTTDGQIDIMLLNTDDQLLIILQDNGSGMTEEVKERLFEPNFTTKNSGMGLGLAIIKNIVTQAGGKIWFESTLNKGTTFYVELPLYEEA